MNQLRDRYGRSHVRDVAIRHHRPCAVHVYYHNGGTPRRHHHLNRQGTPNLQVQNPMLKEAERDLGASRFVALKLGFLLDAKYLQNLNRSQIQCLGC